VDSYREWAPADTLGGALTCLWTRTTGPGETREYRIMPDGCVDLIWSGHHLFVAGPDTGPVLARTEPGVLVGVRLAPGVAPAVLGLPADELTDARPTLAELGPVPTALLDGLAGADPAEALRSYAAGRLRAAELDPLLPAIRAGLRAGEPVARLADRLGVSERSLHRRCLAAFGYAPKVVQRVARFTRAVDLARMGVPFARVAAETGFADQAHLARDVRALAGVPLGRLISD
jgi:AraC-like DNA-binding protein